MAGEMKELWMAVAVAVVVGVTTTAAQASNEDTRLDAYGIVHVEQFTVTTRMERRSGSEPDRAGQIFRLYDPVGERDQ